MSTTEIDTPIVFSDFRLGLDQEPLHLETSQEHYDASLSLIRQANQRIDILSYELEPKIYNHRPIYDALRTFATKDRRTHVRILVHHTRPILSRGHVLIDLAQRLTSFFEIKQLCAEDNRLTQGFLLADQTGYTLRPEALRFEGRADFNDRFTCRELQSDFDTAWHRATTDSQLRILHI